MHILDEYFTQLEGLNNDIFLRKKIKYFSCKYWINTFTQLEDLNKDICLRKKKTYFLFFMLILD